MECWLSDLPPVLTISLPSIVHGGLQPTIDVDSGCAGHLKVVFYLLYDFETLAPGLRLLPSPTAFALPETEILSHEVSGGQG